MHAWGIVDLRVYLAKKNHGYSIPAQSYDFCPHLIQLDILDFTLSHIYLNVTNQKCRLSRQKTTIILRSLPNILHLLRQFLQAVREDLHLLIKRHCLSESPVNSNVRFYIITSCY